MGLNAVGMRAGGAHPHPHPHPRQHPPGCRVRLGLCSALATLAWVMPAQATAQTQAQAHPTAQAGSTAGDVDRGARLASSRSAGLCVLCHALPGVPASQSGTIGPPLAGVGSRLDADTLRARLLTPERFNPDTLMPSYGRSSGYTQVARARDGQPILNPQQIDDVLAWLASLK